MSESFSITEILTALGSVISWIWGLFADIFGIIKSTPLLFVFFGMGIVIAVIVAVIGFINRFKK